MKNGKVPTLEQKKISLGTDAAGIVPSSTMIEFIESNKTTSVEIYEKLARYCDEQMSKAILGQTLTSDSGGGSYAQSKTHNDVRHDLTVADAKALAVTIRRDIIRPLVEFNFGEDAELPFFTFDCQEVEDQKETVEIYKTLELDENAKTEDVAASIMALKAGGDKVTAATVLALKEKIERKEADEAVQLALKEGKITAAQTEWAKEYALKDADGFKKFMEKAVAVVPQGKMALKDAPADNTKTDDVDMAILKNCGISKEDMEKYYKKED